MPLKSLKGKLLLTVSALVIGSGLVISLLVNKRYSDSLFESMRAQAENVAHAVALQAADKILINDLVGLQKMLDHHLDSNSAIDYIFILRDDQILAHTFPKGIPTGLVHANIVTSGNMAHFQKIASTTGEHYLDIAWPIFGGKAGVLRLGLSQSPYSRRVTRLWLQMTGLTLGILLLALAGTLLFVKRITSPLTALSRATRRVENGELGVRVQVRGRDEVGRLSTSFNHMVGHMEEYTRKLEEQAMELKRAYNQTRTFCGIVQEIGALRNLNEIGLFLIEKIRDVLKCDQMALLILNSNSDSLFVLSKSGVGEIREPEVIQALTEFLDGRDNLIFPKNMPFRLTLPPGNFDTGNRQAIIPILHENQLFGALVIACAVGCRCDPKEAEIAALILTQAVGVIRRAVLQEEEIRDLGNRLGPSAVFCGIVGKDPKMQVIYKLIEDIAPTDATVLIQGESGTGKELVARAIHQNSLRKDKPFIVINCSAYPATLLESELFGHERGAFTGAIRQKSGRFEQAHGGTVFLDEVGEISPSAQIKLLRVLQSQKFERLGGETTLEVNVRILAATNKDLLQEVKEGNFREDLFYRLNVILIHLPSLRNKRNDIPLLAQHFLRRFASEQHKEIQGFSSEAMRLLLDYSWPGNVRELENSIEHATVLAKSDQIRSTDLPISLNNTDLTGNGTRSFRTIQENEMILLREVLEECGWNKKLAAQRLGISRSTLYGKIKKYGITEPSLH